jgi:antitoxin (DNA-binding transcriptional repressor) of toxin-antitoxin stability system
MIKTITATEANRHFSALLRLIDEGDTFIVTMHGRPRIRMERVSEDILEREGFVTRLHNPAGQVIPRWAPEDHMSVEERQRAHHEFIDYLRTLPAINIGPWSRDELYDDDLELGE